MALQPRNSIDRFQCYLQRRFSESLGLTPDDIDELVEDLSHWGICDSEKFENTFSWPTGTLMALAIKLQINTQLCIIVTWPTGITKSFLFLTTKTIAFSFTVIFREVIQPDPPPPSVPLPTYRREANHYETYIQH